MASMSETSYWINFFTTAGIPAGDSAHYAIMFADNRITNEMLLDLSKEYLTDMGITRLGDIIAILKHAKHVFNQEAKDRVLRSASLTSLSSSNSNSFAPINLPRRSTAASRMVNQITSKHPEAGPMSQSPIPKPPPADPPRPRRKVSVFERLGADGVEDTVILSSDSARSPPSSVFSRLGGRSALKRAASSTSFDDADIDMGKAGGLPYAGVLKGSGPPAAKKVNIKMSITRATTAQSKAPIKLKKIIKNTNAEEERKASQIQRPEVSTTTEGVLSDFAKKDTPSLKDRLGSKLETPSSTSGSTPRATRPSRPGRARILDRLGTKQEDSSVVSSTELTSSKMSSDKISSKVAADSKKKGVFSRLGRQSME